MKENFYAKNWFMWLMLILVPPVGLVLMWTCHKDQEKKIKVLLTVLFLIWFAILLGIVGGGMSDGINDAKSTSTSTTSSKSTHLYDSKYVQVKDVINGSRTKKIGEYSIVRVKSTDVTEKTLTDWYFNYVEKNNYNWCMILYTDKSDNLGVYAIKGMVDKNVKFDKDKYNDYMLVDSSNDTLYTPTDDGYLKASQK